jgi:hypothetical protein
MNSCTLRNNGWATAAWPFLVYCRVIGKTAFITHIVHGRQDQEAALRQ